MKHIGESIKLTAVVMFVAVVISAIFLITPDSSDTIPQVNVSKASAGAQVQDALSK